MRSCMPATIHTGCGRRGHTAAPPRAPAPDSSSSGTAWSSRAPRFADPRMTAHRIKINRAPVLTLWASVVAERLGYDRLAALSIGKAVAGLSAQAKGRALGIYHPAAGKDAPGSHGK